MQLSDVAVRRRIFWLTTLTALFLWFGFVVYLLGDVELAKQLHMADGGEVRYSGWSINPNQLALFFVPLSVWVAALWRNVANPTRWQMAGFGLLLFALMLMGLLYLSGIIFVPVLLRTADAQLMATVLVAQVYVYYLVLLVQFGFSWSGPAALARAAHAAGVAQFCDG